MENYNNTIKIDQLESKITIGFLEVGKILSNEDFNSIEFDEIKNKQD